MKNITLSLLAATTLFGATVQATTLAAQPLKCGGFVSLDTNGSQTILSVKKVGKSTCQNLVIQSLGVRGVLKGELTQIQIRNFSGVLVAEVNDEIAVLNTNSSEANEIARVRMEIEKERQLRERRQIEAENAAAAVVVGGLIVEGTAEAVSSGER